MQQVSFLNDLSSSQRFSLCCGCWIQVCYSSFKPVWNLHLSLSEGTHGGVVDDVSNVVLSLFHTVCWAVMKVLIHSVGKASSCTGLSVWYWLCGYVDVLSAWSNESTIWLKTHVLVCQPASGMCRSQHCGNCGWWGRNLARIFSKKLSPAGASDVILGETIWCSL